MFIKFLVQTLQCTVSLFFICFVNENINKKLPSKVEYFSKIEKTTLSLTALTSKSPKPANPIYEFGSKSVSVLFILNYSQPNKHLITLKLQGVKHLPIMYIYSHELTYIIYQLCTYWCHRLNFSDQIFIFWLFLLIFKIRINNYLIRCWWIPEDLISKVNPRHCLLKFIYFEKAAKIWKKHVLSSTCIDFANVPKLKFWTSSNYIIFVMIFLCLLFNEKINFLLVKQENFDQ